MAQKESFYDKKFVTADGKSFTNPEHLQSVADGGQLSVKNIYFGVRDKDDGSGKEVGFKIIGGLSDIVFSVNNNVIPLAEIGSDKWLMLMGKTAPANIQLSRYFVHSSNLLQIMSEASGENLEGKNSKMIIDLTTKYLSVARDYNLILEWKKIVGGVETTIRTEIKTIRGLILNSASVSFGQGIVVMERCSGQCQGILDYHESDS